MNRIIVQFVIIAICVGLAVVALHAQEESKEKSIEVVGKGTGKKALEDATNDALRNAVEQAVGTFVYSKTEVKNYAVTMDKILTRATGYISSYKILDKWVKDEVQYVKVRAVVKLGPLKDDWGAWQLLLGRKGDPKLMVSIADKMSGLKQDSERANSIIQKYLIDKASVRPYDKAQLEAGKLRELKKASLEGDVNRLAAIAGGCGVDLIITGTAEATHSSSVRLPAGAGTAYIYHGSIHLKAVRVDDAQIIWTDQRPLEAGKPILGRATSKKEAANLAVANAANAIVTDMMEGIKKAWVEDLYLGSKVTLTVKDVKFADIIKVKKALKKISNVSSVTQDSFSNNIAELTVKTTDTTETFAERLTGVEDMKLEITETSKNKITVQFKKNE